jgi:hypothetical protein
MSAKSITKGQGDKGTKWRIGSLARLLCFLAPLLFCVISASAQSPALRWVGASNVEVTGLPPAALQRLQRWTLPQWQRLLAVYAGPDESLPPMLGTYGIESNTVRFTPQFPPTPGVTYRAVFRPANLPGAKTKAAPLTAIFETPARTATPTTVVSHVYPSVEVVPENLLKFYLHFSAPMSRGRSYEYIRLLDSNGKQIELPFLELNEELWDQTQTRLTLLIDPGRIKRGVLPLEEIGPSLEAGKSYTLSISRAWQDGNGNPLKEDFQKHFRVGPPDRTPPDPAQWRIETPKAGTRTPLTVTFPEPMDQALTQRVFGVVLASGVTIAGQVALTEQERRWEFTPVGPWLTGNYHIVIQTTLEDLAGNNIGKPFEVDLFEGVKRHIETQSLKLPFTVR